jgi:nitrile hydratase
MVSEGYLTMEEIKGAASAFTATPFYPPATARDARDYASNPKSYACAVATPPRFVVGDAARCAALGHSGHTRMPAYVRGKVGRVHAHHGGHVLPDASARGEHRGEHLYTIDFAAADLWPEAGAIGDHVFVDLWEGYLESP